MTDQEKKALEEIINTYYLKKEGHYKELQRIKDSPHYDWHKDEMEFELWKSLENSPERKRFVKESKKTEEDEEFEKVFKDLFEKIFLKR